MLTRTAYRLLAALAHSARRIVPQGTLLEYVWRKAYVKDNHLLQATINRLRHKLETDPGLPRYLLTKHNVSYLLTHPG